MKKILVYAAAILCTMDGCYAVVPTPAKPDPDFPWIGEGFLGVYLPLSGCSFLDEPTDMKGVKVCDQNRTNVQEYLKRQTEPKDQPDMPMSDDMPPMSYDEMLMYYERDMEALKKACEEWDAIREDLIVKLGPGQSKNGLN